MTNDRAINLKEFIESISYNKNQTYNKIETDTQIDNYNFLLVVDSLPTKNIRTNKVYLVLNDANLNDDAHNRYDFYIYRDNKWEQIDSLEFDIEDYYNSNQVDTLLTGKSNVGHGHDNVTTMLDGFMSKEDKAKLDTINPSDSNPLMDGTVSQGSSTKYSRQDHRHPSDTSKVDVTQSTASMNVVTGSDKKITLEAKNSHSHGNIQSNGSISNANSKNVVTDSNGNITTEDKYTHPSYTARTGKPTGNQTPSFGGTATVSQITSDNQGHITNAVDRTIKIPDNLGNGTNKGLTTNDYTTNEKNKLSGIDEEANKYVHPSYTSKSNGLYKVTVDNTGHISGTNSVTASDLPSHEHDTGSVKDTSAYGNIGSSANSTQKTINNNINTKLGTKANSSDVYTKSQTLSASEITQAIADGVSNVSLFEVVTSLPTSNIKGNKFYLISNGESINNNVYDIYIYVNNKWEQIDSLEFDIDNYYTISQVDSLLNGKVNTTDSRLTDSRTPKSHSHGNITNTGAVGTTANLPLITTTNGVITTGSFGTTANTFTQGNDSRLSDARTPKSHTHGNITNDGKIGSTANLPIVTGTSGALTTGSFEGTASNIKMNGTANVGSLNTFARADHIHPTDTSRASTSTATQSANGLLSSADKQKIDKSMTVGYGTLGGTTSAYTVSITGVTLTHGTIIAVYNNVGANVASATLNVNSLGAKPLYYNSSAISASRFPNKSTVLLMYNTSIVSTGCWQLIYSYDSNNTYTAESTATNIKMNGTQATGSLTTYARGDHVHPSDTSKISTSAIKNDLTTGGASNVLSAEQGKQLKIQIDNIISGETATDHNHDGSYIKTGTGTVTSTNIADGTIVNGDIANTTITGGKLVNGTVTATQLASNSVTIDKIGFADDIGGTNLLSGTQDFSNGTNGTITTDTYKGCTVRRYNNTSGTTYVDCTYSNMPLLNEFKQGDKFTLSFWAKGTGSIICYSYGVSGYLTAKPIKSNGTNSGSYGDGNCSFTLTSDWKRYYVTWELNPSGADSTLSVQKTLLIRTSKGADSYICGVMFERGEIAHDWSPSPSDTVHEYIVGTHGTTATPTWTGTSTKITSLQKGQVIYFKMTSAGTSAGDTLNLTLADGSTTGAKNVYYNASTRLTTHFPVNTILGLVYDGTSWLCTAIQNTNNYDRVANAGQVVGGEAITVNSLIYGKSDGKYYKVASGGTLDIRYPIYWLATALASGGTATNLYSNYLSVNIQNTVASKTLTASQMCYLEGTLSKGIFTISSNVLVNTLTDGKFYIPLGFMTSTTNLRFNNFDKTVYKYTTANGLVPVGYSYNDLLDKPSSFTPSSHTHPDTQINWNGSALAGSVSPIDMAMYEEFSANRLAYLPGNNITVEYSTNGGSTWTDYGATTEQKLALVTTSTSLTAGKGATASANNQLRITINAGGGSSVQSNVYLTTRKLMIYYSTSGGSNTKVKIETSTYGTPTTWTEVGTYNISGYSGWNSYPLNITYGGMASQTTGTRIQNIRLTFTTGSAHNFNVQKIRLFGENCWIRPSTFAETGHLYTYDNNQNVTFPSKIIKSGGTSSQFLKADGSVDSNTYLTTSSASSTYQPKGNYLTSHQDISGKAPNNHASTATTYGVGTTANYGHNKIIDDATKSSLTNGESLSAHMGYVLNNQDVEFVVSTHTSSTSTWTGTCSKLRKLETGTKIYYRLNQDPTTTDVTLNLTLADSSTTGAKNVYFGETRLKNQYPKYAVIGMVFDGSNWIVINQYTNTDTNTTYTAGTGLSLNGTSFNVNYGTSGTTACVGNDSRLSDARTPLFTNKIPASSTNILSLNTYRTGGFYFCGHNTNEAPYITDCPLSGTNNKAFFLLVETWGQTNNSYVKQTLTYYHDNTTYTRTKTGGTDADANWTTWLRIDGGDKADSSHTHGYINNDGTLGGDSDKSKAVVTNANGRIITGTIGTSQITDSAVQYNKLYEIASNGGSTTTGYAKILQIKVTNTYQNVPISFDIYQRQSTEPTHVSLAFASTNNTDPAINSFTSTGYNRNIYIYKESTSTWSVIVQKSEAYDTVHIRNLQTGKSYAGGSVQFTALNSLVTTLPTNTTTNPLQQCTYIGFTSAEKTKLNGIATGANKTTIVNDLTTGGTGSALSAEQGKTLNTALSGKASSTHAHGYITNDGYITNTSGSIPYNTISPLITTSDGKLTRGTFSNQANTFCEGNDSRLSDTRTPTDNTVSTAKIVNSAVTSAKIADGTIVNGDIANTTITGGKLVNGTVTATQLASNSVETAKIKDGAVTSAKIASDALTTWSTVQTFTVAGVTVTVDYNEVLKLVEVKFTGSAAKMSSAVRVLNTTINAGYCPHQTVSAFTHCVNDVNDTHHIAILNTGEIRLYYTANDSPDVNAQVMYRV